MVIFHSYVSLPEAKTFETSQIIWLVVEPTPLKNHGVRQWEGSHQYIIPDI